MSGSVRHAQDKERWDRTGWCVLESVVPDGELAAAQGDLHRFFPSAAEFASDLDREDYLPLRTGSDAVLPRFPFDSDAINSLVVHNVLIDLAEEFLETQDLRIYQGLLSAKYSNGAPDYEQLLHADYGNHTLVVPRPDVGYQQLEMFVYLNDVSPDTAATRVVSRELTAGIPVERTYLSFEEYPHLYAAEEPASGSAGSVLLYRPDTYHRGVALTAPAAARFMLHVSFKPAGTDWLGYQAWPSAAESMAWHRLVPHLSVRQLCMLGFPGPNDAYWTQETLSGVAARYPRLDMAPWRQAHEPGPGDGVVSGGDPSPSARRSR
ncbi:MAG: phytanoyl-CoA dioxygenase family protein [Acidimicrobiales bacterium]